MKIFKKVAVIGLVTLMLAMSVTGVSAGGHHGRGNSRSRNVCGHDGTADCTAVDGLCAVTGNPVTDGVCVAPLCGHDGTADCTAVDGICAVTGNPVTDGVCVAPQRTSRHGGGRMRRCH